MRDILNAGIRLLAVAMVAALALAGTNMITRGPIAEHQMEQARESEHIVMPDADDFTPVEWPEAIALTDFPSLSEAHEAYKSGKLIGYVFIYKPMGYKDVIPVSIGMLLPETSDDEGIITGISIGDISETSGLGSRIKEEPFISQFVNVKTGNLTTDVSVISGATISSGAVKNAVRNAVEAFSAIRPKP